MNKVVTKFDPKNPPKHCTFLHEPLDIEIEGKKYPIYATTCIDPKINNADVYISLDQGAKLFDWEKPWINNKKKQQHLRYFIKDMTVPDDAIDFDKCLDYTLELLKNNKKVHVGCISGHGRTGLFLSALVHKTIGQDLLQKNISAIQYVRDNYCAKSVETLSQVLYLNANYDILIPKSEEKLFQKFKNMFKEETGYTYEDIIKLGGFMEIVDLIEDIEMFIYKEENEKLQQYYTKTYSSSPKKI